MAILGHKHLLSFFSKVEISLSEPNRKKTLEKKMVLAGKTEKNTDKYPTPSNSFPP